MPVTDERLYYPDSANELTLEWVVRQFNRLSQVVTGEETIQITYLTSSDSPYTVKDGDKCILADTASGAITINLQAGQNERLIYIKNIATSGANKVTVSPNGSDDIDRTGVDYDISVMTNLKLVYSKQEANWFIL